MPREGFWLERRVPLALVFTLFLQAAMAVWWASAKDTQDHFRDARILEIGQTLSMNSDRQIEVLERLTRLEVKAEEARAILQRLDARLAKR